MFQALLLVGLLTGFAMFVWWLWRDAAGPSRIRESAVPQLPRRTSVVQERVLFICTHNSARSQMAEAFLRHTAGERFLVASAGTIPTRVHELAAQVMAERGLSLRSHRAKALDEVGTRWDYAITLCDVVFELCPEFPEKTNRLHWSIEDPSGVPPAQQLEAFRRVRDDLARRIGQWVTERAEKP